eukprot:jgi/Chrzof1/10125/Cz04g29190.t1
MAKSTIRGHLLTSISADLLSTWTAFSVYTVCLDIMCTGSQVTADPCTVRLRFDIHSLIVARLAAPVIFEKTANRTAGPQCGLITMSSVALVDLIVVQPAAPQPQDTTHTQQHLSAVKAQAI